jgi:hypothetical protein
MYFVYIIYNLVHFVDYLYIKDLINACKMVHIKINLSFCRVNAFRTRNILQMSPDQQSVHYTNHWHNTLLPVKEYQQ